MKSPATNPASGFLKRNSLRLIDIDFDVLEAKSASGFLKRNSLRRRATGRDERAPGPASGFLKRNSLRQDNKAQIAIRESDRLRILEKELTAPGWPALPGKEKLRLRILEKELTAPKPFSLVEIVGFPPQDS